VQSTRGSDDASSISPLLDLAPGGGCLAARLAADAGALLPRRFTLAAFRRHYASLWPSSSRLPRSGRYPAPRSVESGLSSTAPEGGPRLPGSLEHLLHHSTEHFQAISAKIKRPGLAQIRRTTYHESQRHKAHEEIPLFSLCFFVSPRLCGEKFPACNGLCVSPDDTLKGEIMTTRHRGWIALMALGLAVLACSNLPGNGGATPPPPTTAPLPPALLSGRVRRQPPRRRSGERCQPAVKEWPMLFLCVLRAFAVNRPQMRKSTERQPGRRRG